MFLAEETDGVAVAINRRLNAVRTAITNAKLMLDVDPDTVTVNDGPETIQVTLTTEQGITVHADPAAVVPAALGGARTLQVLAKALDDYVKVVASTAEIGPNPTAARRAAVRSAQVILPIEWARTSPAVSRTHRRRVLATAR